MHSSVCSHTLTGAVLYHQGSLRCYRNLIVSGLQPTPPLSETCMGLLRFLSHRFAAGEINSHVYETLCALSLCACGSSYSCQFVPHSMSIVCCIAFLCCFLGRPVYLLGIHQILQGQVMQFMTLWGFIYVQCHSNAHTSSLTSYIH